LRKFYALGQSCDFIVITNIAQPTERDRPLNADSLSVILIPCTT